MCAPCCVKWTFRPERERERERAECDALSSGPVSDVRFRSLYFITLHDLLSSSHALPIDADCRSLSVFVCRANVEEETRTGPPQHIPLLLPPPPYLQKRVKSWVGRSPARARSAPPPSRSSFENECLLNTKTALQLAPIAARPRPRPLGRGPP